MSTMTIQLPDGIQEIIRKEAVKEGFADPGGYIHAMFIEKQLRKRRSEIDAKLLEALDEYDRGECTEWHPGDFRKLADKIIAERRPNHENAR